MEIKRKKFQGVLNILSFNRHFYVVGLAVLALLFSSRWVIDWPESLFLLVAAAFLYGFLMPLFVSAWVYDFSGFYTFKWLEATGIEHASVNRIVNINAGFDETSFIIAHTFPEADIRVFDFYNADQHTEPAIKRARKVSLVYPNTQQIASGHIPIQDAGADLVFLLSAIHEIRTHEERVQFLKECYRICKPGGRVIMVEHLRDLPNFLAFTIGFTHFFSKTAWKKAFETAGFSQWQEIKFTAFMSVFNCRR
jgi:ubiquinone/menaquinone biosynthesis C-methylase UbiE